MAAIAVIGLLPRLAGGALRARPGGCLVEDAVLFHDFFAELRDAAPTLTATDWSMLSYSSFSSLSRVNHGQKIRRHDGVGGWARRSGFKNPKCT